MLAAPFPLHAEGPGALEVREVAPGIFLHPGLQEDMTAQNFAGIANIGFVVGEKCVAIIDSGGTKLLGEALRQAVKRRTDKPICYVINSHVHPDHIFGNAAFKDGKPVFVGHHKLPAAMAARGQVYAMPSTGILAQRRRAARSCHLRCWSVTPSTWISADAP